MSYAEAGKSLTSRCLLAVLLVAAVVLPGCQPSGGTGGGGSKETSGSTETSSSAGGGTTPAGGTAISDAAKTVLPSVVYVVNEQSVPNPNTGGSSEMPVGSGSGIIISADGNILTNNHVISGSDAVTVRVGEEDITAKIVGRDAATDLAVIKIDRTGLTPARIGDPKALIVGQWVIAVGFPFGLDRTVTAGVVSALGASTIQASQSEVTAYTNLIQTDAAINPGNSGGALADLDGRVLGVNTLIESSTGQNAGIGFAIPIDFAMSVADQLVKTGKAEHTFMGVSISSVSPHGAPQANQEGALVEGVEKGSPAEKAGIKKGDIIVRIGTDTIRNSEDVFAAVRSQKPGDTVPVEVKRNGKTMSFQVTLVGRTSS